MAMGAAPVAGSGLSKFLSPRRRIQSTDIAAAASWTVAAATTALWLIQPFDWLKKKLFEKPEEEK
ncbi:Ubiquinol-cytochrome c reductase complex 6.7 kDa protein [Ananas comosus]|nr:Ubiquinol-cytochrome c reductase complex 6.7 kDa protein [Ananas comosus]